jgi:hypothetical protein
MPEIKLPFQVVCINDKNRPREIPPNKWIKKGAKYTVDKVGKTLDNKIGFVLAEIELGDDTFPYDLFSAHRFGLIVGPTADEVAEEAIDDLLQEVFPPIEV